MMMMMMMMVQLFIALVCLIPVALSQLHCHRCYGNSYCLNATSEDFPANVRNVTCNVAVPFSSELLAQIDDPLERQIYKALNENLLKDTTQNDPAVQTTIQGHCLSATVHEPHDSHTLRTCVTRTVAAGNNQTLCDLMRNIMMPFNRYNGTFSCSQCNGSHFCNTDTHLAVTPPSTGTIYLGSLLFNIVLGVCIQALR